MRLSSVYWLYLLACIALAALRAWHERERAEAEVALVQAVHAHVLKDLDADRRAHG